MLGIGKRSGPSDDRLPVLVQVVQNNATFTMAQKIWVENTRAARFDPNTGKEFLRFGLVKSEQAVWFERDKNRPDSFEIILSWRDQQSRLADVYVVTPSNVMDPAGSGDAGYLNKVLEALLTTPATLPVDKQ